MQQDHLSTLRCENKGTISIYLNSKLDINPTICSLKHMYQITALQILQCI